MIFGRRRKRLQRELEEARAIRLQSEVALQRDTAQTRIPLREMRERNHITADVIRVILIKKGGKGEPGSVAH